MKPKKFTLPIRRWMVIALVLIVIVPPFFTAASAFHFFGEDFDAQEREASAALVDGSAQWTDPDWQASTKGYLADRDYEFVLTDSSGVLYQSAVNLFGSSGTSERQVKPVPIPGDASGKIAYLYTAPIDGPPSQFRQFIVIAIGIASLVGAFAVVTWFFSRSVIMPLRETTNAAASVGAGELDVSVPSSRVREVQQVTAAFSNMSQALKHSLEEQTQMEQERRLFIGAIVHDLRTPLFALRGYLDGLSKGIADTPEKHERYVTVAKEKADMLERLVSDLFDYTRIEYLDETPVREPVDLGDLANQLTETAAPRAEAKGLSIAYSGEEAIVAGDKHQLSRVIENLIGNAIRYTPSGGKIDVNVMAKDGRVSFSVADTGPGIPAADLPHLFKPLYRGEASRNRKTGGVGLGLTIARKIMTAHGGELTATNRPEGGALFTGTLPAAGSEPSRRPSDGA
jgi:signal transduction histidine kinase